MAETSLVDSVATRLRDAERAGQPMAPVRDLIAQDDMTTAYAVQQSNVARRLEQGERIVGRKIGLTSLAVQKQLGVDQPDFGTLFASMAIGDGEPISLAMLIAPKIEAEIALVLAHDLLNTRHTYADILYATAFASVAIEVVDSRIRDWDIRFVDTVADNASSARFVIGSRPVPLSNVDLATCEMRLMREGDVLSRGNGAACLGNPINAAVWLADRMVAMGTPLRAGDVVLTGALGPMVAVTAPGTYIANVEGMGSVRAIFSA